MALAFVPGAWALVIVSEVASIILVILPMFYLEVTKPVLSINKTLIGLILSTVT